MKPSTTTLTTQQIRQLKSRAHALKPVVRVGQQGVTPAVLAELDTALDYHELLKVKLTGADRDTRQALIDRLCRKSNALCLQRIGGIAVLYRRNPNKLTCPE